ncbi:MAG: FeoB-associated Cys-rich membrane protein [Treponemataceae bacterium]|nr:FeoB-associated Cys-rich membrane protein [Treponemataceae bacterium]
MGTIIVLAIVVAIVLAIIVSLIKSKKKGKHSCGGDCSSCSSCSSDCSAPPKARAIHKIVLEIDGMMCHMCESHVNDAVRNNFQVKSVKSSFKTGMCVIFSKEELDTSKLEQIITNSGYKLKNINVLY